MVDCLQKKAASTGSALAGTPTAPAAPAAEKPAVAAKPEGAGWTLRCDRVELATSRATAGSTFIACGVRDGAGAPVSLHGRNARLQWEVAAPDEAAINALVENPRYTPARGATATAATAALADDRGTWALLDFYTEDRAAGLLARATVVAHVFLPDPAGGERHLPLGGPLAELTGLVPPQTRLTPFPAFQKALGPTGYRGACDSEAAIYGDAVSFCVYRPENS